jgi:IS30 family transposase
LRAGSDEQLQRFRGSCGATLQPEAAAWSIARRQRNGMPIDLLAAQSRRSLRSTRHCEPMWRNDWQGSSSLGVGLLFPARLCAEGRRHGPRQYRRWANAWSPEQIARRLPVDFPDDETMRISHEAIYQALFVQSRGALRRELTACLRTGRVLRMPRARTRGRGKTFISPEIMISQRPAEAADRAVPGHWEGDLILGLGSSAIGTLVERMTRFTLLLHLPRMTDHGHEARVKNGPALAGHGAEAVCDAITRTIITLPEQLRRSLTWDQGAEMAQHARLKIDAGIQVYFCDPHSPWQRGTNENTNGLLRQYFPKGIDLSMHSADDIAAVAAALNTRPRKTLAWQTPAEALDQLLISASSDVRN